MTVLPWETEKLSEKNNNSYDFFEEDCRAGEYEESFRKGKVSKENTKQPSFDDIKSESINCDDKKNEHRKNFENALGTMGFSDDDKRYILIVRSLISARSTLDDVIELGDKFSHPAAKFYVNTITKEFANNQANSPNRTRIYIYPNIKAASIKIEADIIEKAQNISKKQKDFAIAQKIHEQKTLF